MYLFTIQIDSYIPTMKPSAACGAAPRHPPKWHKLGPQAETTWSDLLGNSWGNTSRIFFWTMEAFLVGKNSILIWLVVGPPLWKIWTSIGMISNPILMGKSNMATKPPTSNGKVIENMKVILKPWRLLNGKIGKLIGQFYWRHWTRGRSVDVSGRIIEITWGDCPGVIAQGLTHLVQQGSWDFCCKKPPFEEV